MTRVNLSILCIIWLGGVNVVAASPLVTLGRLAGTYSAAPLSGEFMLVPNLELAVLLGSGDPFQSFCVEAYESLTIDGTYGAYVNDEAILGGGLRPGEVFGPDGGDSLSPETASLYTEFRRGTLSGYVYAAGSEREASALSLQTAIWYLEGEVGYQDFGVLSPQSQFFVVLGQDAGWATIGDVRVLNLYEGKQLRQDMLALVPTSVVPIPGAVLLASIGAGLVGWLRRRRTL